MINAVPTIGCQEWSDSDPWGRLVVAEGYTVCCHEDAGACQTPDAEMRRSLYAAGADYRSDWARWFVPG